MAVADPEEVHDNPAEWFASLDDGLIYHKHTCEVVEDYLDAASQACRIQEGTPS